MSSLQEFLTKSIKEAEEQIDELDELKKILEELDEEPKIIYTVYDIKANT